MSEQKFGTPNWGRLNCDHGDMLETENENLRQQLDAIRAAMHGYPDSDLVSLATTLQAIADKASEYYEAMLDAQEEAATLRRQLDDAQQARQAANARAAQAEARRQYESVDSYNQRINDALRSFSTDS